MRSVLRNTAAGSAPAVGECIATPFELPRVRVFLRRRPMVLAAFGLALLWLWWAPARAADLPTDPSAKATHLYEFTSYVEWPPQAFSHPDSPLVIAVAADEAVRGELSRLVAARSVPTRGLVVRRWAPGDPVEGVHMLFVGHGATGASADQAWMQPLRRKPVLLVTEDRQAFDAGSVLNFVQVDGKVRFEASVPAAELAGLKLSARMLAVAHRVVRP